ncbi:MAG TPA: Xaa-Pro peptidase family protein [Deinococcales bacterium]|nr:Xaa-Pro peptidase family protein [Deinococcales bacterium]
MSGIENPTPPLAQRLADLQALVRDAGLDGWLLYGFRDQNPLAARVLDLPPVHLTRRWFLLVPLEGRPSLVRHRIERAQWDAITAGVEVATLPYSSHQELRDALASTLGGLGRVAMEYSPGAAVPYVSRVDAGTLELVREAGPKAVSSADLLQHFLTWSDEDRREHDRAMLGVVEAKTLAFQFLHDRLRTGDAPTELDAQAVILETFRRHGLECDSRPIVAFGSHGADPHFEPNAAGNRVLTDGTPILIDLWATVPGRPYADITWVGHAGQPGAAYWRAWTAVSGARDAAISLLESLPGRGWNLEGWEVDRAAREVIERAGMGADFTHRLGHALGRETPHGESVNLDDLETHDTRRLLPGLAVTVEPGVYPPEFGIRSEVNVYLDPNGPRVTSPVQRGPYIVGGDVLHEAVEP